MIRFIFYDSLQLFINKQVPKEDTLIILNTRSSIIVQSHDKMSFRKYFKALNQKIIN